MVMTTLYFHFKKQQFNSLNRAKDCKWYIMKTPIIKKGKTVNKKWRYDSNCVGASSLSAEDNIN